MSWASILKSLLLVCVFTAFAISTVESYYCVRSSCVNGGCAPDPQRCEASKGCFNRVQDFKTSVKSQDIIMQEKGCAENTCTNLAFSATLGDKWTFDYEEQCCGAEQCNKEDIKLPHPSSKANGVECPACYNEQAMSCNPVPLKCTGAQTKCVEVIGTVSTNTVSQLALYGMGCATETACNLSMNVLGTVKIRTFCKSGSPPLMSMSSILTGLLLLKIMI